MQAVRADPHRPEHGEPDDGAEQVHTYVELTATLLDRIAATTPPALAVTPRPLSDTAAKYRAEMQGVNYDISKLRAPPPPQSTEFTAALAKIQAASDAECGVGETDESSTTVAPVGSPARSMRAYLEYLASRLSTNAWRSSSVAPEVQLEREALLEAVGALHVDGVDHVERLLGAAHHDRALLRDHLGDLERGVAELGPRGTTRCDRADDASIDASIDRP